MTPAERAAWQKAETILSRFRAAQERAVYDFQRAGFPVLSVDDFLRMRAQHHEFARTKALLVVEEARREAQRFHPEVLS